MKSLMELFPRCKANTHSQEKHFYLEEGPVTQDVRKDDPLSFFLSLLLIIVLSKYQGLRIKGEKEGWTVHTKSLVERIMDRVSVFSGFCPEYKELKPVSLKVMKDLERHMQKSEMIFQIACVEATIIKSVCDNIAHLYKNRRKKKKKKSKRSFVLAWVMTTATIVLSVLLNIICFHFYQEFYVDPYSFVKSAINRE